MEKISLRRPLHSLHLLLTSRLWMVAFGFGWIGWGLYIAALRLAPLSIVQSITSGGLPLLAFIASRFGKPVAPTERIAALMGGLGAVLVCSSLGKGTTGGPGSLRVVFFLAIGGLCLAAIVGLAGRTRLRSGAALGLSAGLSYAVSDIATKGAVDGTGVVLVPILIAASAVGFALLQLSYQRGGVLQTAGLSSLITAVLPIVAGVGLYHEYLPPGAFRWVRVVGFGLSVVAGVLLSARRLPTAEQVQPARS